MDIKRPRHAKGDRPTFFNQEPAAERLLAMVIALAGELAVLRERLDTIERLGADKALFSLDDIEAYEPPLDVQERREQWCQDYLDRLFRVLDDEAESMPPAAGPGAPDD